MFAYFECGFFAAVPEAFEAEKVLPALGLRFLDFLKFGVDDGLESCFGSWGMIFWLKVAEELFVFVQQFVEVLFRTVNILGGVSFYLETRKWR